MDANKRTLEHNGIEIRSCIFYSLSPVNNLPLQQFWSLLSSPEEKIGNLDTLCGTENHKGTISPTGQDRTEPNSSFTSGILIRGRKADTI